MLIFRKGLLKADGTVKMVAALDMNSHKVLNLTDGAGAQDAAAFHQAGGGGGGGFTDGAKVEYAGVAIATPTFEVVPFDTLDYDSSTFTQIGGAHPSRLTVPVGKGGKYLLVGLMGFQVGPRAAMGYQINGAGGVVQFVGMNGVLTSGCIEVTLADGDYVEFYGYDTGVAGSIGGGNVFIAVMRRVG
jgi:hypothetical protein